MSKYVYEYILDGSNMVLRIVEWAYKKKRDLDNNPPPPADMWDTLFDVYNRPQWRFQANVLTKLALPIPTPIEEARVYLKYISKVEMLKKIGKGIEDKNDPEYVAFIAQVNML